MDINLIVIKALLKSNIYNKYISLLNLKDLRENNPYIYKLVLSLKELYNSSSSKEEELTYSTEDLYLKYSELYPNESGSETKNLFSSLDGITINEGVVDNYFRSWTLREDASKLALQLLDVGDGSRSPETVRDSLQAYSKALESSHTSNQIEELVYDIKELLSEEIFTSGIKWRLQGLNRSLGPIRGGDFGFIFARPETGKTTFLCSEVTYFAEQIQSQGGGAVAWFNNEEKGTKVLRRIVQAALGSTAIDLGRDVDSTTTAFKVRIGPDTIRFFDHAEPHRALIERACAQIKPKIIVIDQLDKVKGFDGEREDLRQGKIYQWARELAKKNDSAVIGVTQADGTAEGVRRLSMDYVANAKTSKQAEADFILGIGASHEEGYERVRYISICKNKLLGGSDTEESRRHDFFEVLIRPEIARYEDME